MKVYAMTRKPAFAVHGLGLNRRAFDPIRCSLGEDCHLVALDLIGHGDAPRTPEPSLGSFVDHVVDEIAGQAPPGGIHLVGHSFGGVIAAMAVPRLNTFGHEVVSLSLLGTPAEGGSVFLERAAAVMLEGLETFERTTIARWFGQEPPPDWAGSIDYASSALPALPKETICASWRALASFRGFSNLVLGLRVLCIAAEDDLSAPPKVMAAIVEAIQDGARGSGNVELRTLPRGGHLFPLTMAPTVATMLREHWSVAESERAQCHGPAG